MLSEEEYRAEWKNGLHQTDYNNCRFATDKEKFAEEWIKNLLPDINLKNPQNIVDRINWCKIYDKDPRKTLWCNKIWAHNEIERTHPELSINPTYIFNCETFTREMFDSIPDGKWIFKCNHGSGWNLKFEKKPNCNPNYLISKLNEWLFLDYSYICGWEWQYNKMKKGIIVQPDLGSLLDWCFWCENGNIFAVQLIKKINKNVEEFYCWCDENGNKTDFCFYTEHLISQLPQSKKNILDKLKPYAKELAQDFKFVRVDLYSIDGQPKFGELTFTPCSGNIKLIQQ